MILYFPTTLQRLDELIEINCRLVGSLVKCGKVFGIFSKNRPHCFVDHVGYRAISDGSSQPKRFMDFRVEIHSGALRVAHEVIITSRRRDVKAAT